ncbi:hypothetical protein DMN91_012132 [Ooceraea biroi]|uniref:X-box-binding protein 1 n=1 Tax=Ooceraea biroi TaxID=2015173 RepID=A0A026WIM2_OOCBI|nr:X-box-binding protein [Ooceraea biroi]RLU16372.1 hypothetical protein DMN91_012132 [Ooceraea biroi]
MSSVKSVIITLPKGLPKALPANELTRNALSKLSFTTSILADKARMEVRKVTSVRQQEESHDGDVTVIMKPSETCVRGKKRRLDHLTWEEKLQRKKLKNRVAAQTSRDRKKAKLDELEDTVRTLKERNELLTQECAMLKVQNDTLLTETKRLRKERDTRIGEQQYCSMCQARVSCAVPLLGSAVSPNDPLPQGGTAQPASCLTLTPGATVLLKILTLYLLWRNCLATSRATTTSSDSKNWPKAFCEKLPPRFKQILIDQMNNRHLRRFTLAERPGRFIHFVCNRLCYPVVPSLMTYRLCFTPQVSVKEDPVKESDHSEAMVGQASENVETDRAGRGVGNGAAYVCDASSWHPTAGAVCGPADAAVTTTTTTTTPPSPPIKTEVEIKQESEPTLDMETLYGTYDMATNSITIIYPGEENGVGIQECVQEVVSSSADSTSSAAGHLNPSSLQSLDYMTQFSLHAYPDTISDAMNDVHSDSGASASAKLDYSSSQSDVGYESYDSPDSRQSNDLADLWHESFTELFPMLA